MMIGGNTISDINPKRKSKVKYIYIYK